MFGLYGAGAILLRHDARYEFLIDWLVAQMAEGLPLLTMILATHIPVHVFSSPILATVPPPMVQLLSYRHSVNGDPDTQSLMIFNPAEPGIHMCGLPSMIALSPDFWLDAAVLTI